MDDRRLAVRFQARGKIFYFFQNLQTDSGTNSASYSNGTWGCYAREKRSRSVKLTTHLHVAAG
jgi:hypothetical protein